MFRANIELDDNMEESAEDIAAAETAPRPTQDTHWNLMGIISWQVLENTN